MRLRLLKYDLSVALGLFREGCQREPLGVRTSRLSPRAQIAPSSYYAAATMKREVLQDTACWPDELMCRRQVFKWLVRYNTRRRHTWCGYLSPSTYEARRAATLSIAA